MNLFLAAAAPAPSGLGDAMAAMNTLSINLLTNLRSLGFGFYANTLGPFCLSIGHAILPTVLILSVGFAGIRVADGKEELFEALRKICLRSIIVYVLIGNQFVQINLVTAMMKFEDVGASIGITMGKSSLWVQGADSSAGAKAALARLGIDGDPGEKLPLDDSSFSAIPVLPAPATVLWSAWLLDGSVPTGSGFAGMQLTKFDAPFERDRYFTHTTAQTPEVAYYIQNQAAGADTPGSQFNQTLQNGYASLIQSKGQESPFDLLSKEVDAAAGGNWVGILVSSGLGFMDTAQGFLNSIGQSIMSIGCIMAPAITSAFFIGSAYLSFFLILALSYCTWPLLFVESHSAGWRIAIHVFVGAAILPFIYHICSGISFALVTTAYEMMFPVNQLTTSLPVVVDTVIAGSVAHYLVSLLPAGVVDVNHASNIAQAIIIHFIPLIMLGARAMMGAAITSSFVLAGVGMGGLLAPLIANSWASNFATSATSGAINQGLQSAYQGASSGMQSMWESGMSHTGQAVSHLGKGIWNKLKG